MNFLIITYLLCHLISAIFVKVEGGAEKVFIRDDTKENDEVPRVKIKVFRGPSKEQDGEKFTTWGFWIKQPAKLDLAY